MNIHVSIKEIGYLTRHGREKLLLSVVVSNNKLVIHDDYWTASMRTKTTDIGLWLMNQYAGNSYAYQSMWTLPETQCSRLPLRNVPDQIEQSEMGDLT